MTPEATLRMAARQAWQGWRNGEFGVLLAALFVAVLALAGVGSIAQRTTDALAEQSRRLVGGDAAFSSDDRAIDVALRDARRLGLRAYRTVELVSMVASRDAAPQLGTLKALADDAPLLGPYTVRTAQGVKRLARPTTGGLWLSAAGAERMRVPLGGTLDVGGRALRLDGIVVEEPDRPLNGFELGPRVILPLAEVNAGGLLGPGARANWRVAVAGAPSAVARWVKAREADRSPGARVETGDDLNPQLRAALDRAQRFLSVSLVLTAALAAVAIGIAARQHAERHRQIAATLRALGAGQRDIVTCTPARWRSSARLRLPWRCWRRWCCNTSPACGSRANWVRRCRPRKRGRCCRARWSACGFCSRSRCRRCWRCAG